MKRIAAAGVVLVFGVIGVLIYAGVTRDREYRRLIAAGDQALAADQIFLAIEAFSGALALRSDSMLAHLRRGETYRRRGELAAALRDLRTATQLDPGATRPLEELADVNYALGQYANAERHYAAYLQLDDRTPRVLYKLALVRHRRGSSATAAPLLVRALDLDPEFADAQYLLGLCLSAEGRLDAAVTALTRAVDLAPGGIEARDALAALYAGLGDIERQIDQLDALTALDPGRAHRPVALSLAYARAGRTELAVLTLGRTAERYPEEPKIFLTLARIWLDIAERDADRVALGKAMEALDEPTVATLATSDALLLKGRALLLTGDADAAERTFRDAAEAFPVTPAAFRYLSQAAQRRGDLDVARDALVSYHAVSAGADPPAQRVTDAVRIGDLALQLDEPGPAAVWFQVAVDLAEPDVSLLRRLADAQWRAGHLDAARAAVERGLTQAPRDRALLALRRRLN